MDVTWLALLAAAFSSSAQNPSNRTFGPPEGRWELAGNPYNDGSCIGAMYIPNGRLRSVSFYHDGHGSSDDPPGWEKRAVLRFDETGRCVETETWMAGTQYFRSGLLTDPATGVERLLAWIWYEDEEMWCCDAHEILRDLTGRPVARLIVPWRLDGSGPSGVEDRIQEEYQTDDRGRVIQKLMFSDSHLLASPVLNVCRRDSEGRALEVLRGRDGSLEVFEKFAYDTRGNVISEVYTTWCQKQFSGRYRYDTQGRMIASTWATDDVITRSVSYQYAEDGRLVARSTCESERPMSSPDQRTLFTEETLEGIDRPLTCVVWDEKGREISKVRWTYEGDSRGNWIKKSFQTTGLRRPDDYHILRRIEYAD
jgi:hypothetical protein